jgi:hypothetical protein
MIESVMKIMENFLCQMLIETQRHGNIKEQSEYVFLCALVSRCFNLKVGHVRKHINRNTDEKVFHDL